MSAKPTQQFSVAAILKLILLLSIPLALYAAFREAFTTAILGGAVVGVFLAEHFGGSRKLEMVFFLGAPLLGGACVAVWRTAAEVQDMGDWGGVAAAGLLAILVGLIPAVVAVVVVNAFSGVFHLLTGIQLVKYRWNESEPDET